MAQQNAPENVDDDGSSSLSSFNSGSSLVPGNETKEEILLSLRDVMASDNFQIAMTRLRRHFHDESYHEELADIVIDYYILPCPEIDFVFADRIQCAEAAVRTFLFTPRHILPNAINRRLTANVREEQPRSKNLCKFAHWCLQQSIVKKEDLRIDESTGVYEEHAECLRQFNPNPTRGTVTESGTFRRRCRRILSFISCGRI